MIDGVYEVKDLIGHGGMGVVFRVFHREWNLELAVKMPLPAMLQDPDAWGRFIREAETWIDLGVHPNIVQCWYVQLHDGLPLLFLDFCGGGSLQGWFREGRIYPGDWGTILDLVIQTCDGLAYSHSHGVVHRDVKPGNLLVKGEDRVCVTDFGMVKMVANTGLSSAAPGNEVSLAGGTAEYAAPEQWDGIITPAVDIYSLGVVLYEFCAGVRPFRGKGDDKPSAYDLVVQHRTEFAVPPIEIRPDIPRALNDIIMACMEKDPADRPRSMSELRQALSTVYHHILGTPYPRPVPHASEQRAAALNNRGVSLWNLGKREQALEAWNQANQVDALHCDSCYNRLITGWRLGQVPDNDVFEGLHLAHANLQLGYFLVESGRVQQATRFLTKALQDPQHSAQGAIHRVLADSLMYQDKWREAKLSYARALKLMPGDEPTLFRQKLAQNQTREVDHNIFFPKVTAIDSFRHNKPVKNIFREPKTGLILAAGPGWLECWHPYERRLIWAAPMEGETPYFESDGEFLYATKVEVGRAWRFADGELYWEQPGRLLAVHPEAMLGLRIGAQGAEVVDLIDGSPLAPLTGVLHNLTCGAFTQDGEYLMAGDDHGLIGTWQARTGRQIFSLPAHDRGVSSLKLIREDKVAISLSPGSPMRVWELEQSRLLVELPLEGTPVSVDLDPKEEFMMVRSNTDNFVVYRIGGEAVARGSGPASFAEGGVLYQHNNQVIFYSISDQLIRRRWAPHKQRLNAIACDAHSRYLLTGSEEGILQWWHFDEGNRVFENRLLVTRSQTHQEAEATREAFETSLAQAQQAFEQGDRETAYKTLGTARANKGYEKDPRALDMKARFHKFFGRRGLYELWERRSLKISVPSLKITMVGEAMAILGIDGRVEIHGASQFQLPLENVCDIDTASQNSLLVVATSEGEVSSWTPSGERVHAVVLETPLERVRTDATGRFAVVASEDGQLLLLDLENTLRLKAFKDQDSPHRILTATADLKRGLTGPTHRYWDLLEGRCLDSRKLECPDISCACISETGRFAFVADPQHVLRLLRLQDGEECLLLRGHSDHVVMLHLWEQLEVGISASADGLLLFWDLSDRKVLKRHSAHTEGVVAGWASPDGRFVVTSGADQVLKVWELEWDLTPGRAPGNLEARFRKKGGKLASFFGFGS